MVYKSCLWDQEIDWWFTNHEPLISILNFLIFIYVYMCSRKGGLTIRPKLADWYHCVRRFVLLFQLLLNILDVILFLDVILAVISWLE